MYNIMTSYYEFAVAFAKYLPFWGRPAQSSTTESPSSLSTDLSLPSSPEPSTGAQYGQQAPIVASPSTSGGALEVVAPVDRDLLHPSASRHSHTSYLSSKSSPPSTSALRMNPAPLRHSASRWRPPSIIRHKQRQIYDSSPEIIDRKVRALLNKLTMERFDSISNQIISWANKSENEHDGRTLIQVIRLVFEKATDEAAWSEMYARLCRKMMEQISPKVQDEDIKDAEGKPIAGGQLFRKYLLNRCQEDFERGWAAKDESGKVVFFSEEYYAAQKAKRQGLGLIKFIGELFKLRMLTERIVHECVKKLLGNVENPKEEDIKSLCMLFKTVGELLDTAKARAHVDVYFSRMKELMKNPNINYRMVFMLLDLIELRERKWKSCHAAAGPTTISAVHALAAKETAAKEKDDQCTLSMSRGGFRHGGDRGEHRMVPDGWAVAGNAPSRVPSKGGDLSNFGKISKTNSMTFGPMGVLAKDKGKRESAVPSNITTTRPDTRVDELLSTIDEQVKADLKAAAETFFTARDLEDGKKAFSACAPEHRWRLINRLVLSATMRGAKDARLVGELFSCTTQMGLCPGETFELGFAPVIDTLDVLSLHIPAAPRLVATMLKGAGVDSVLLEKLARRAVGDDMELLIGLLL